MSTSPVTLQINLAPSDYWHARTILPHQIATWRAQVAEILITVDFHRSPGRFSERWEEGREKILPLAASIEGARVVTVEYGQEAAARVSSEFFSGRPIPAKDFRGGPYYAYFFGLSAAQHNYVFHTDSDIFFGGGSQTWVAEAVDYLELHPEVLFAAPLPGPPAHDGRLRSQTAAAEAETPHAFRFDTMSTRLFLFDRRQFRTAIGALRPRCPPALRDTIKAMIEGNPPQDLPEHLFADAMQAHSLWRREFLGSAPGMWSLHPPYRCRDFYERLPELVRHIERGEIPNDQRGDHDLNSSMVNWSEALSALAQNRWWRRLRWR
jgi:hypothetical protein